MEFRNLLILLISSTALYGVKAAHTDDCKTPHNQPGICVVIRECPSHYELLRLMPIPNITKDFLKASHCGFEKEVPKICCPKENVRRRKEQISMPDDDVLPSLNKGSLRHLLPTTEECGIDFGRKILGGQETDLDEFPWMTLLIYELPNGLRRYGCAGALINERYILTAAHCLLGKNLPKLWKLTSVRLGEYNKDSDEDCTSNGFVKVCLRIPPFNVTVEERIPHEFYDPEDPDQKYDIALLRLAYTVKYSDYVKPICLPISDGERLRTYNGTKLTVAGWGQTENRSSSSAKMKLRVPVVAHSRCKALYSEANKEVSDKQICAGGRKNEDSCKGDSGGPLMCLSQDDNGDANWYLAGIVSYGPVPCGEKDWPGVYTRVGKFMGWILRHMKP